MLGVLRSRSPPVKDLWVFRQMSTCGSDFCPEWFRQLDLAHFDTFIWPTSEPVFWIGLFKKMTSHLLQDRPLWPLDLPELPECRGPAPKIGGCRWRGKRREPVGRLEFPPPPARPASKAGGRKAAFRIKAVIEG
jgi:hypothetical protein